MNLDDFRRVHDVNLYGVLHGIQVFGKRFIEQGTAAGIYNIGSENSLYPCVPSAHAYVSSNRYKGDDEYDIRCLLAKMKGKQK